MKILRIIKLLTLFLLLQVQVPIVFGQPLLGPSWTSTPPTIDGVISAGEWELADTMEFNFVYTVIPGKIYVMNDADNLYIALEIQDNDDNLGDDLIMFFDNDNGGGSRVVGDNALEIINIFPDVSFAYVDSYIHQPTWVSGHSSDVSDGGSHEGLAMATHDVVTHKTYYEVSFPLDTADDSHDFSLVLGDVVGFTLLWWDFPGFFSYFWPAHFVNDVDNWADIEIAERAREPVGGSIMANNSLMKIPAFLVCSVIVILYLSKRKNFKSARATVFTDDSI